MPKETISQTLIHVTGGLGLLWVICGPFTGLLGGPLAWPLASPRRVVQEDSGDGQKSPVTQELLAVITVTWLCGVGGHSPRRKGGGGPNGPSYRIHGPLLKAPKGITPFEASQKIQLLSECSPSVAGATQVVPPSWSSVFHTPSIQWALGG